MLLLKRIFAILTLVALIAASLLSSAECWIYQPKACAAKMQLSGGSCHEAEPSATSYSAESSGSCYEAESSGSCHSAESLGSCRGAEAVGSAMCGSEQKSAPCQAEKATSTCMMPVASKDCEKDRDCRTRCFRLLSNLLADRPNRVQYVNPDPGEARTVELPVVAGSTFYPKAPDDPPPWGIHPSVATTVLRI